MKLEGSAYKEYPPECQARLQVNFARAVKKDADRVPPQFWMAGSIALPAGRAAIISVFNMVSTGQLLAQQASLAGRWHSLTLSNIIDLRVQGKACPDQGTIKHC